MQPVLKLCIHHWLLLPGGPSSQRGKTWQCTEIWPFRGDWNPLKTHTYWLFINQNCLSGHLSLSLLEILGVNCLGCLDTPQREVGICVKLKFLDWYSSGLRTPTPMTCVQIGLTSSHSGLFLENWNPLKNVLVSIHRSLKTCCSASHGDVTYTTHWFLQLVLVHCCTLKTTTLHNSDHNQLIRFAPAYDILWPIRLLVNSFAH